MPKTFVGKVLRRELMAEEQAKQADQAERGCERLVNSAAISSD